MSEFSVIVGFLSLQLSTYDMNLQKEEVAYWEFSSWLTDSFALGLWQGKQILVGAQGRTKSLSSYHEVVERMEWWSHIPF